MLKTPERVLDFWFSDRVRSRWFDASAAFDEEIRATFGDTYRAAAEGELLDWARSPEGALALVIVLDQFPLNMFRGKPASFAGEAQARRVAAEAIARGFDATLNDEQKGFLYLPFMHSEDLDDQRRSVDLYERAGLEDGLKWARHHLAIVERFGRFPHRNAVLGRESTPEERAYLEQEDAFKG